MISILAGEVLVSIANVPEAVSVVVADCVIPPDCICQEIEFPETVIDASDAFQVPLRTVVAVSLELEATGLSEPPQAASKMVKSSVSSGRALMFMVRGSCDVKKVY